jgi:anthranilate phosphoribosyltransferase
VDLRNLVDALFVPWGLMMTPMRRAEDDEDVQSKALALVKPLMMPVFTAALAVVGINAGPVDALQEKVMSATNKLTQVETELLALKEKVDEISTRRNLQVAELEKRILSCELKIAEHGAKPEQRGMR